MPNKPAAKESTDKDNFVISRSFAVPREKMFDMWTDTKHVSQWLPPLGFDMEFIKADIKAGGSSFYCMSGMGVKMYGRADYIKVQKPDTIIYTQQFCDQNEKVTRHPMIATWPETMHTTIKLDTDGPKNTLVTITWVPYGNVSPAELETFSNMKPGMAQGWAGSLDKLEEYLAK